MNGYEPAVQTRLRKAYNAVGGARFKLDTTEEDFSFQNMHKSLAAVPREKWGECRERSEWKLQKKWEWPEEPDEAAVPDGNTSIAGIEVKETLTKQQARERANDLTVWKAEGMKWIDGFTATGRKKVLRFLHENDMAMTTVMGEEGGT